MVQGDLRTSPIGLHPGQNRLQRRWSLMGCLKSNHADCTLQTTEQRNTLMDVGGTKRFLKRSDVQSLLLFDVIQWYFSTFCMSQTLALPCYILRETQIPFILTFAEDDYICSIVKFFCYTPFLEAFMKLATVMYPVVLFVMLLSISVKGV